MRAICHALSVLVIVGFFPLAGTNRLDGQATAFSITIDPPVHGRLQVNPPLPADGKYPAGTSITLITTPDAGYVLDSAYYAVPGRFGQMYHEGMTREFKVIVDQNKRIGEVAQEIVTYARVLKK